MNRTPDRFHETWWIALIGLLFVLAYSTGMLG
jgi:uncharacterized membrane protein